MLHFNNTIITIADDSGNVIAWASAGSKGFKGSRKSTPYAAQIAADDVATKAQEHGLKILTVKLKGPGAGRETALRALQSRGFKILSIKDTTTMPHKRISTTKKKESIANMQNTTITDNWKALIKPNKLNIQNSDEYFYTNDVFEQNETYHAIISTEASLDEYYVVEVYGEEPDIYMEENDIITEDHDGLSEYQGRTIYIEEDDVTHEQIKADDALGQWEKRRQKWT